MNKTSLLFVALLSCASWSCDVDDLPSAPASAPWAEEVGAVAQASSINVVSDKPVSSITQSTGNLYWTSNVNLWLIQSSYVLRTSKNAGPGSAVVLYSEVEQGQTFGPIVWAQVGGTYYAYFAVAYEGDPFEKIKRVSLDGGPAVTLLTAGGGPYRNINDLSTDGTFLYWVDDVGVRRVPIGGGSVRLLAPSATGRHEMVLDGNDIYYTVESVFMKVPKAGGTATVVGSALSPIRSFALYRIPLGGGTRIYWGEQDGSVRSVLDTGGVVTTYQGTHPGFPTTGLTRDGSRLQWANCPVSPASGQCWISKSGASGPEVVVDDINDVNALLGDASALYYAGSAGISRYVY